MPNPKKFWPVEGAFLASSSSSPSNNTSKIRKYKSYNLRSIVLLSDVKKPEIGSWEIGTIVEIFFKNFIVNENKSSQNKIDFLKFK